MKLLDSTDESLKTHLCTFKNLCSVRSVAYHNGLFFYICIDYHGNAFFGHTPDSEFFLYG